MALSVVDIYRNILPRTNCGDCGYPTCFAFAGKVVSEKVPLDTCPHLDPEVVEKYRSELKGQHESEKSVKRDMAEDALKRARERAASIKIADLAEQIGGNLIQGDKGEALELPYFTDAVIVTENDISRKDGVEMTAWEQVVLYMHLAQGGSHQPTGTWKAFGEYLETAPNQLDSSRKKWYLQTMVEGVEKPLIQAFKGKPEELVTAAERLGIKVMSDKLESADVELYFQPLPRIPVLLLFWDEDTAEGFDAQVKLLFDETITDHLDIDSIVILSQRIRQFLCGGRII